MIFENLNLEKVILSETLKRRTWFKTKAGDQILTCHRTYKEILDEFPDECEDELKGLYRNHEIPLTAYQEAWKKHLMKNDYSLFLTIKLPHTNQDGYRRTRNRTEALGLYKKLIQELECYFCETNNWKRNPLHFIGILESGKSGFWHIHLAIPRSDNVLYIVNKLCMSITQIVNKHKFYKTVFDLRLVHDQEGLCMYMVKELRQKEAEGSEIFYLGTLFKGIKKERYIIKISLNVLELLIRVGLWIKQILNFNICKSTGSVKKKLFQKRFNRTGDKVDAPTNFDSP